MLNDDSDDDDIMMEEIIDTPVTGTVGTRYLFVKINVSTKTIIVHTHELMNKSVLSLITELHKTTIKAIQKVEGSGWAIFRFDKLYHTLHINTVSRTGSYIKTPENTNILNVD